MRIGDRARFETESREASEFDSPSHRWRGFPRLVKGLRWNRSVRKDTSVQIALPTGKGRGQTARHLPPEQEMAVRISPSPLGGLGHFWKGIRAYTFTLPT